MDDTSMNVFINGYKWFGNNRKDICNNAWRGSGGVGFLISNEILENFDCGILNSSYDDILWIYLKCKYDSEFVIHLCISYLQPEHSCRGNIAHEFFDVLLSQIYLYSDASHVLVCGDFNGRIGDKQDFDDQIDFIPTKYSVDTSKNKFGDYLINFLKDAKYCVLNGRGDQMKDDFTFVSTSGKSVVDYIAVPYTDLTNYSNFKVHLISDIISEFEIQPAAGATMPDHSVLTCELSLSDYLQYTKQTYTENNIDQGRMFERKRVYQVKNIPNGIFTNERCRHAIANVIEAIECFQSGLREIDNLYKLFVDTLHSEMDQQLVYKDKHSGHNGKRRRKIGKPYWNSNVNELLNKTHRSEKDFLRCNGNRRTRDRLKQIFIVNRKSFDKCMRQAERQYQAEQRNKLKTLNTQNPKEFWKEVNKLGPKTTKQNIDSVFREDGTMLYDTNEILERWRSEYSKLFSAEITEVDDLFMSNIEQLNAQMEAEIDNLDLNESKTKVTDATLNDDINIEETKSAMKRLKSGKSVGVDNLPNEILKNENLLHILTKLFNLCFTSGIVPSLWCKSIICPILKSGKDYRDPYGYRGISLMSTVAKLFSSILNSRMVSFFESENILCEEQNGFRPHIQLMYHSKKQKNTQTGNIYVLC
ncbi:unnamed protein product [Mytilus edulis]|uniref:Reverse transcriptase domain-containing protein n=1 Tax=Mytilus edulis TaxID=6550 RepID=A0A8S3RTW1_MYTED|nr:unnamed protein product [Mytilus edulis]